MYFSEKTISSINLWKEYARNSKSLSKNSIESYFFDICMFFRFLSEYRQESIDSISVIDISKNDVRAWLLFRKDGGASSKTIARGLSAIKSFLQYEIGKAGIQDHIVLHIRPPKIEKTLPRPLKIQEINEILEIAESSKKTDWLAKRDAALLTLIYSVGLRISEALSIDFLDIQISSGFVNIHGKGGKIRNVPLVEDVKNLLLEYHSSIEIPKKTDALFVNRFGDRLAARSIQGLLQKARRALGLSESTTPHTLRHSCATHIMEYSSDLRGVQELLGHSSISSTQIYTELANTYVSDAYDKYHPLSKIRKEK